MIYEEEEAPTPNSFILQFLTEILQSAVSRGERTQERGKLNRGRGGDALPGVMLLLREPPEGTPRAEMELLTSSATSGGTKLGESEDYILHTWEK